MWIRFISFSLLAIGLLLTNLSVQRSRAEPPDDAPWKHYLTGEDAKRVEEFERKFREHYDAGRYAEAREPARQALDIRTRVQGRAHWQVISAKTNLEVCTTIAALPKVAQDALTEANKLDQGELTRLRRQGLYRDAVSVAERIVAIRTRYLGPDASLTATALNTQAICCNDAGQYTQAATLLRQVLALSKKIYGETHPNTGAVYGNLGISLGEQGNYEEARDVKEKALKNQIHSYGEESESTAVAYSNWARWLEEQVQYEDAAKGFQKSLAILQRLSGEQIEQRAATSQTNLAGVLTQQGRFAEAEREHQQAMAIKHKLFGDDHPEMATSYNGLGLCRAEQGKYRDAETLYRRALEINNRALGEDHPLTIRTYNNLAFALTHLNRLADAELLLRRALHLQSSSANEENRSTAVLQNNLAHNLQAQGRHAEAKKLLEQSLAINRKVLKDDHADTAFGVINLAVALNTEEKYDEADAMFRSGVATLEKALGAKHRVALQAKGNLAGNLYFLGKSAEAESIHRQVLDVYQQVLGESHPTTAWAYKNLIIDLWVQGKYAEAEKFGAAAAESLEGARRRVSFGGLERTAFADDATILPLLAAVAASRGNALDAWQYLENSLARGLLDDLSARPWTEDEVRRKIKLFGDVERLEGQITALLNVPKITDTNREKVQDLRRQRDVAQKQLSELQAELSRKYGATAGKVYGLPDIQSQIPEDTALVAWVDFAAPSNGPDHKGEHWGCVVRRAGSPVWVRLAGSGERDAWTESDEQLARQFRRECGTRPGTEASKGPDLARKLYAQRLKPVEQELAARDGLPAARRLVILPSARMRAVPVEALTEEVHPGRFAVSYVPSGTVFAWLQEKRGEHKERVSAESSILTVGDPIFAAGKAARELPPPPNHGVLITAVTPNSNAAKSGLKTGDVLLRYGQTKLNSATELESAVAAAAKPAADAQINVSVQIWRDGETLESRVGPGPLGAMLSKSPAGQAVRSQRQLDQLMRRSSVADFRRLKGAEREILSVNGAFRSVAGLTGSEASEQNLRKYAAEGRLSRFRYLHIATHGLLDSQSPMRSALILSQDQLPDPLQQVIAGQPAYDGRITAEQILHSWQLDADLVTLSACETALGKYSGGEGYIGFSQALFLAGARSLVLSLWKIDDASTALLMTRFYENLLGRRDLKEPMSKAQALAEAKTWLRGLTAEEAEQVGGGLIRGLDTNTARGKVRPLPAKQPGTPTPSHPYAHPYYWAAFILIGDPK